MHLSNLNPRKVARVLFDEFHSESWSVSHQRALEMQPDRPENSSYQAVAIELSTREFVVERNIAQQLTPEILEEKSVLVLLHPCDCQIESTTSNNSPKLSADEIRAVQDFVKSGGGLLVVSEYENQKYGNNLNDLVSEFGITIDSYTTVTDRVASVNEEKTHVLADINNSGENLLIGVKKACFYRAGSCRVSGAARILLAASATAKPKYAGLIAVAEYGRGRVVVVNDSDLFGDEFIRKYDHMQLWLNLVYWLSENSFALQESTAVKVVVNKLPPEWMLLKRSINAMRQLHSQKRQSDNSYKVETQQSEKITELVCEIKKCVIRLKQHFPHNGPYLDQVIQDFVKWENTGYQKPDFLKSLNAFNPQTCRKENIEHLVVFPLYTPNNSLDIHFEALIIRVPWYDWLDEMERTGFKNNKFVPGHLIDYTDGYESECAVLFPETVSIDGPPSNNFGIIFCDREARRYQKCVRACADILCLNTPPDLSCFIKSLDLVTDMFAAWDLVHDTSHAMGPLPFDPFMIRQLAPFWMYGLEELRVDLRSVRAGIQMENSGFPFGKTIAYGVLFDRIFRFAITGSRVKNYDGLAGQFLFAALHKKKALTWENNRLTISWNDVFKSMEALSEELEKIYDDAADHSRVRRYIEGHKFISKYLPADINSKWQNPASIRIPEKDFKLWIGEALDDEFPLGGFHTQLKKKYDAIFSNKLFH